jgi:isopentenyl-diphosphate delta-isomerase
LAESAPRPTSDVVSNDDESLILVDDADRVVGHLSKWACHQGEGVLHRAFSIFIFDREGRLLLQQRSQEKLLWPLYWSNSCCSHPREGETMDEAVDRRLREELGLSSDLLFLFKFQYQARYKDVGSENEMCWVYLGITDGPATPNPHEIADIRWVTAAELDDQIGNVPEDFTPWFQIEWPRVRDAFRTKLGL